MLFFRTHECFCRIPNMFSTHLEHKFPPPGPATPGVFFKYVENESPFLFVWGRLIHMFRNQLHHLSYDHHSIRDASYRLTNAEDSAVFTMFLVTRARPSCPITKFLIGVAYLIQKECCCLCMDHFRIWQSPFNYWITII